MPVAAAAALALTACSTAGRGATAAASSSKSTSSSTSNGVLRLVVPNGYVQDGSTAPGVNWVGPFEDSSGCTVQLTGAGSDTSAVQDMTAHDSLYDAVLANPTVAGQLVGGKLVAPIQVAKVNGYSGILAPLRTAPGARSGSTTYGVPYLWDTYSVGYNTKQVTGTPNAWNAVFAPSSAAAHRGRLLLPDTPETLALAALYLKSARPSLRIGDPFELTSAQLKAATGAVRAVRSDVGTFWRQDSQVIGQLGDGQDALGAVQTHQVGEMADGGLPVGYLPQPSSGSPAVPTVGFVDSWLVSAHDANPTCTYKWLSWSTSQYVQQRASQWTGFAPASPAGCAGTTAAICGEFHEKSLASATNIDFAQLPVAGCGNGRTDCTTYSQWVSDWQQIVPSYSVSDYQAGAG